MRRTFLLTLGIGVAALLAFFSTRARAGPETGEDETEYFPEPAGDYAIDTEQNLAAFLSLIRQAESRNDYYALVGGGQFSNTTDHPANTGEFAGIPTRDGRRTTAAGAYQITQTTWNDLGGKTIFNNRSGKDRYGDFSPAAQDAAAIDLIARRGALDDVMNGNFDTALTKLRNEWEAFTMMLAGTYPITLADARAIYENAGGTTA